MPSQYQLDYNKARGREAIGGVDAIDAEIQEVQAELNGPDLSNSRKEYLRRRIQTLKIKKKSYIKGDPVKESKEEIDEASYKVDKFDIEDVKTIADDMGIVDVPYKTIVNVMRNVYKKYGRQSDKEDKNFSYDEAIKKELQIQMDMEEESQGAVTTASAGNISTYGGQGNYAPKIGMVMRFSNQKKKKKKKNEAWDYLSNLMSL